MEPSFLSPSFLVLKKTKEIQYLVKLFLLLSGEAGQKQGEVPGLFSAGQQVVEKGSNP